MDARDHVVALCDRTVSGTTPGAARVAAQWTYDAYGNVTSADHLHPHALLHCGHKGLFAERLDVGVADVETPGFAMAESPRLVPFARLVYHNRNRMYSPGIGRFVQADPNASGLTTQDTAHSGSWDDLAPDECDLEQRHCDGANLFAYLGGKPWTRADPTGLRSGGSRPGLGFAIAMALPGPLDYATGVLNSLVSDYAANLEWDVEWATRWDLPDDDYTRTDSSWVELAMMRGLHDTLLGDAQDIEDMLLDPLNISAAKKSTGAPSGAPRAGRVRAVRGGHTIHVRRGQSAHINYRKALPANQYDFEVSIQGVGRVDAIDVKRKIVRELKPDTPSGRALGAKQLNRYLNALRTHSDAKFRGNYTGYLDFYNP